uniref:Bacteriophage phiKZ, Orf197 n=1 Tax=uncultured Caudovirales phage TaxID=2100421 RepID=A0A6J5L2L7_9CAUD|nr:Bacteriophage phiKZ, Orf197 [uncultured Caudovirales phage]
MAIFLLIWLHFICDFILQTDRMAQHKSKSNRWLAVHIAAYSAPMLLLGWRFAAVNAVLHFATDWVSSRATSRLYAAGERHWFFVVIGADQAVHLSCLVATIPMIAPVWG